MEAKAYLSKILKELEEALESIDPSEMERLITAILAAKTVFISGAGRTGLAGKAFCMRLMHMGIDAYVLGETVTSNFTADDLLILGSGSGETASLISYGQKAKKIGGNICAITIKPASSVCELADFVVKMPGAVKDRSQEAGYETIQPMGSLFEQILFLFYDAIILGIMEKQGLSNDKMYGKHANLE